jgi:catechol 2,3-dioxygenase-like lactoylglutathione lyase family enzyme
LVSIVPLAQGAVIGMGEFPHGVKDIQAAVDYYQNTLGFELVATVPPMVNGKWEPNVYDKELQALMDVGGAYYRIATLRFPNSALRVQLLELINNQDIVGLREARSASGAAFERGGIALRVALPIPITSLASWWPGMLRRSCRHRRARRTVRCSRRRSSPKTVTDSSFTWRLHLATHRFPVPRERTSF